VYNKYVNKESEVTPEMKTLKEVRKENPHCYVFTTREFFNLVKDDLFNCYDGIGFYHDGENETDINIWGGKIITWFRKKKYPYVCWYNK